MATLYVPRCGQGMVEDFTSGIGSSSPAALSALASAMASAGITGGPKASGNIALSGALAAAPTESTHGSITIPSGAAGIAIFSAAFLTTVGNNVAGFNAASMILYKNGQRVAAHQNAMYFPSAGSSASSVLGACAVVPVAPGDVLSVRATLVGFSSMSVDGANAHAYYVVI